MTTQFQIFELKKKMTENEQKFSQKINELETKIEALTEQQDRHKVHFQFFENFEK